MEIAADVLSGLLLAAGSALLVIGALGLVRLPDVFARMHGAGIVDTLGMGCVLLGLAVQAGPAMAAIKLVFVLAFVFFTSPITTHALARAALADGVKPLLHGAGPEAGAADKEARPSKT
jgi:multicomponent Na+:H+ antiporter subunit G